MGVEDVKIDARAGKPDTGQALAMLTAFASVGATAFGVTLTNIEDEKIPRGFKPNRTVDELRRTIARALQEAE